MKKKGVLLTVLLAVIALISVACGVTDNTGGEQKPNGPFDFDGNYVAPELTIDGKGDDPQWQAITEPLAVYGHNNAVSVKAYRGEKAMFFLFDVTDSVLLTNGNSNDDTVTEGDSVELYIDTLADGGLSPKSDDFQINLGIHGKTRIMQGAGGQWGGWNGLIDYEVELRGALNNGAQTDDEGYGLEVMVPYAQIGIEKDDTVGIAFGQVDKVGLGNQSGVDWDWYGWTYNGNFIEPQTIDNYVLWDKDGNLVSREDVQKPDAEIGGTVLDSSTKEFVEGATVTVTAGGEQKTQTTDGNGFFTFGKVSSNETYTVTVSKNGYISNEITYTRAELRAANGGVVVKNVELTALADAELTTVKGTVKNILRGKVENARVRIDGTAVSEFTDENGEFTIENVPVSDTVTLIVTKEGFGESRTEIKRGSLTVNGTSELGDININLPYAELGTIGAGANYFANTSIRLACTLDGIEVQLEGTQTFSGHIEVFVDTKASADHRDKDSTCWRFDLGANGSLGGEHYMGAFNPEGLKYVITNRSEKGYEATLLIPYDYLGINALEVFGVTAGHWSTTANDWRNLLYDGKEIFTEVPKNYLRIAADNAIYTAANNNASVALSGNVGVGGVTVKAGEATAVSGADGSWEINCAVDAASTVTVQYSRTGYLAESTAISAGYFFTEKQWSENKTLTEQKVLVSGTVTNRNGGAPVANVTVKAKVTKSDGTTETLTATTSNTGDYSIANVSTFADVEFTFELAGYETETVTVTAETFMTLTDAHTLNAQITATSDIKEMSVSGTVKDILGIVEAPVVKVVDNNGVHTPEITNGEFVLTTLGAFTVTVSKSGYITKEISVTLDDLTGETHSLGDIFLARDYAELGGTFGAKSDDFANFTPYVTRGESGFMFKFVGGKAFKGHIELFVDTKGSSQRVSDNKPDDKRNETDYRFNLNDNGIISVENWGGGNTATTTLDMRIGGTETEPEVYFNVPYAFLGVTPTEIIGVSLGQWSTSANDGNGDWDGWNVPELPGYNGSAFVVPEMTMDYIRIGVDNTPFNCNYNYDPELLDLSGYQIHFAQKADSFYSKVVSRDSTGVTFEFITLGDFGMRNGSEEMVVIFLDTGATVANGWENLDGTFKISSDGTVYYRAKVANSNAGALFQVSDSDKTGETVEITRKDGITRFTYKMTYERLKIGQNDVFGVAMREGVKNSNDPINPWYDCFFEETHYVDAAWNTQYIRVAADGTLYSADSNAAANA